MPLLRNPVGRGSLVKPRQSHAPAPSQHLAATGDRDIHPQLRTAGAADPPMSRDSKSGARAVALERIVPPRKLLAATFSGAAPIAPSQFTRAIDAGVERTLELKAPPEGDRL